MQFSSGGCSFLVDAVSNLEDAVSFLRCGFLLEDVVSLRRLLLLNAASLNENSDYLFSFLVNHEFSFLVNHEGL